MTLLTSSTTSWASSPRVRVCNLVYESVIIGFNVKLFEGRGFGRGLISTSGVGVLNGMYTSFYYCLTPLASYDVSPPLSLAKSMSMFFYLLTFISPDWT